MITDSQNDIKGAAGKLDRRVAAMESAIASLALAAALLTSLYAVIMRWLRVPTGEWVLDLPVELLLVIAVYGTGALVSRRAHMRVVFILDRLAPASRLGVTILTQSLLTCVCAVMTSRAAVAAGQASAAGMRRRELFYVSEGLLVWISVVGFACWTLHTFIGLIEIIRTGRPGRSRITPAE